MQTDISWQDLLHPGDATDFFLRRPFPAFDPTTSAYNPGFYTGHSMGAELATQAAARHPPSAAYTFGSPRVGNQAFITSLSNVPIYRIVDDEDIVTTVPSEAPGFRHVGTELRLPSLNPTPSLNQAFGSPNTLADHAPINYVNRI